VKDEHFNRYGNPSIYKTPAAQMRLSRPGMFARILLAAWRMASAD
jgi:hypothetical protein